MKKNLKNLKKYHNKRKNKEGKNKNIKNDFKKKKS